MASEEGPSESERLADDLLKAVDNNSIDEVISLLDKGADPNHQLYWSEKWIRKRKWPPLFTACCFKRNVKMVKVLVKRGADVDKGCGKEHFAPLHGACLVDFKEGVEYLIMEARCKVDVRDKDNQTSLHLACREGSLEVVRYLVEEVKCDVDVKNKEGNSPLDVAVREKKQAVALYLFNHDCGSDKDKHKVLMQACESGELNVVKKLVEQHSINPRDVKDGEGNSPLDVAVRENELDIALYLFNHDCGSDKDKHKVLMQACESGELNVVKKLVEQHSINPRDVKDGEGNSPLDVAVRENELDIALYLFNHDCGSDKDKHKVLMQACESGELNVVKELVEEHNINPKDVKEGKGNSLLDVAVRENELDIALYLFNHDCGSDKDKDKMLMLASQSGELKALEELVEQHNINPKGVRDDNGKSPLDLAMERVYYSEGFLEVAHYLMSHGFDSDKETLAKLLCGACLWGKLAIVKDLVEQHKLDPKSVRDDNGKSPLDRAMENNIMYRIEGCPEVAHYLMSHGFDSDKETLARLLCGACRWGKLAIVKDLVEQHKIDPKSVRDDNGKSPLDRAMENVYTEGCPEVAHYLMSCGCDSNETTLAELLCGACRRGKLSIVKDLVEQHKTDPNSVRGKYNSTPLQFACWGGNLELVQYLAEELKCNVDVFDNDKWTPLHSACDGGHKEVAQYLVEKQRCNIEIRDKDGQTPLHLACEEGHLEVIKYLVESLRFDVDVTDDSGNTPLNGAIDNDHTEVVKYLNSRPLPSAQPGDKVDPQSSNPFSDASSLTSGLPADTNAPDGEATITETPLSEEDSDALQRLLLKAKVKLARGRLSFEKVRQQLISKGLNELATNLREELDKVIEEQQQYLKQLEDLMIDKDTVDIRYLKTFLVGPPGVGKTTTLNRLLKAMENISISGDNRRSTLLANCIQVVAFVSDNAAEWLSSRDVTEETKLLLAYLFTSKSASTPTKEKIKKPTQPKGDIEETPLEESSLSKLKPPTDPHRDTKKPESVPREPEGQSDTKKHQQPLTRAERQAADYQRNRLIPIKARLHKLIATGDYSKMAQLLGNTLLNINDIGGQPGFLEMLPALSTGPAMYLVFLDLSKELDKPYKIPFDRDGTIITPFDAIHTVEATISQILSAIASVHCISRESTSYPKAAAFSERFERFQRVTPVVALIGTHKDRLDNPEERILEINEALKNITQKFKDILVFPPDSPTSFFTVDNYTGTEQSDIGPIREFMNSIFRSHFKDASLPVRPKWLIFGTLLRKEYKIVKMDECLELGDMLGMDKKEVEFCIWYLSCIGTLMYYTDIADDEDDWFKNHVICSPQVIFDSISQLILATLCALHSKGYVIEKEREELIKKGQFSIESIEKYCFCEQVTAMLKREELIPAKQLVKLLDHVNLLSPIVHKEAEGERITYLMPAVLECATQDELSDLPPPDEDSPDPILITFSCGYVPTGTFCGLVTQLVSRGPNGILGLEWSLVEDGVKRNCISFYVDFVNKVTLICHDRCYEIRVTRSDPDISLHDLCTYLLSVIRYLLKHLYSKLVTQVAFYCPCPKHSACKDVYSLCTLMESKISKTIKFTCKEKPVQLRSTQQPWLGKHVTLGESGDLEVFKFAEDDFFYHWTKVGSKPQILTTSEPNVLTFQSVSEKDLGYYRCEVREAGKVVLTVYRALYKDIKSNDQPQASSHQVTQQKDCQPSSQAGLTLKEVKKIIKEARSQWLDLGIELEIDMTTLMEIRSRNHYVTDDCFTDMLSHWLNRPSPPPTKETLIDALKSPAVGREDLAKALEGGSEVVKDDIKLKEVRNLVWDVRSQWEDLGIELNLSPDSLKTFKETYPQNVGSCFREMLSLWLKRATPPPSWQEMADALRSPVIGREDIAIKVEAKAQEKKQA